MNQLFFGDNLNLLREPVKDESVDLIYLAPPFTAEHDYNLLFKTPHSVAVVYDRRSGDARRGQGEDSMVADRRYSKPQKELI